MKIQKFLIIFSCLCLIGLFTSHCAKDSKSTSKKTQKVTKKKDQNKKVKKVKVANSGKKNPLHMDNLKKNLKLTDAQIAKLNAAKNTYSAGMKKLPVEKGGERKKASLELKRVRNKTIKANLSEEQYKKYQKIVRKVQTPAKSKKPKSKKPTNKKPTNKKPQKNKKQ